MGVGIAGSDKYEVLKYKPKDLEAYFQDMHAGELEEVVNFVSQLLFEKGRQFVPLYPWVFIRVLKKEQKLGSLILPDKIQNKTVWEGVVLSKWKDTTKREECPVEVGEHVLFPHWAGAPVNGYSDNYRIVRATQWGMAEQGGIFAKVLYTDYTIYDEVASLVDVIKNRTMQDRKQILEKYVIVDRDKNSATMSGR